MVGAQVVLFAFLDLILFSIWAGGTFWHKANVCFCSKYWDNFCVLKLASSLTFFGQAQGVQGRQGGENDSMDRR